MEKQTAATIAGVGLVGAGGVVLTGAMMGWFGDDELPEEEHSPVIAASTQDPSSAGTSEAASPSSEDAESSSSRTDPSDPTNNGTSSDAESSSSAASSSKDATPSKAPTSATPTSEEPAPATTTKPAPTTTAPTTSTPAPEPSTTAEPTTPKATTPEATTPKPTTPKPTTPKPTTPAPEPPQEGNEAKPGDPVGDPVHLTIPSIGFDRDVSQVGLTSKGTLNPPPGVTGWYGKTVKPGENGISVIAGHVTYGPPDVFYELPNVKQGAEFTTTDSNGKVRRWKVDLVEHIDKVALSRDSRIWGTSSTPKLALVTCDPDTPRTDGHSAVNVFVLASPA